MKEQFMNKLFLSLFVLTLTAIGLQAKCIPGISIRIDPALQRGDLVIGSKGNLIGFLRAIDESKNLLDMVGFGNGGNLLYLVTEIYSFTEISDYNGKYAKVSLKKNKNMSLKRVIIPVSKDLEICVGDTFEKRFKVESINMSEKADRKDLTLIKLTNLEYTINIYS